MKPILDAPIPGQSWTNPPNTMPWDRPPQFADVNEGLTYIFKKLRQPDTTKQMLNLMDAGMPVDMLAEGLLMQLFMKGTVGAPALIPMVGPLNVMLIRMAETAGITPQVSTQMNKGQDFDPLELLAAQKRVSNNRAALAAGASEKSVKDLTKKNVMDKQGFMAFRPTGMPGRK
jgi:hypothetical protein